METHERSPGALIGLLVVASLCIGVGDAYAQSSFFLRLAPEVGQDYGRTHQESDHPGRIEFEHIVFIEPRAGRQPVRRACA